MHPLGRLDLLGRYYLFGQWILCLHKLQSNRFGLLSQLSRLSRCFRLCPCFRWNLCFRFDLFGRFRRLSLCFLLDRLNPFGRLDRWIQLNLCLHERRLSLLNPLGPLSRCLLLHLLRQYYLFRPFDRLSRFGRLDRYYLAGPCCQFGP